MQFPEVPIKVFDYFDLCLSNGFPGHDVPEVPIKVFDYFDRLPRKGFMVNVLTGIPRDPIEENRWDGSC